MRSLSLCTIPMPCRTALANEVAVLSEIPYRSHSIAKSGKPITKVSYIYNFEGMTISKATDKTSIELLLIGTRIFQDNYPERIREIYVINAAAYFSILFSVVKTLAPQLFNKVYILGAEKWREELLDVIDADELPGFLGGNKTDPDGNPLCNSFIIHGTTIPESYYLKKSEKNLTHCPEAKKLIVTRLSKENLTFEVEEGNSLLEWEFETKNKDIAFGMYFKENSGNESKPIELLPKRRIDTDFEPETGMFKCEQPGRYLAKSFCNVQECGRGLLVGDVPGIQTRQLD
ncbi:SEC14-like protein 2 [Araneus ventricosus]|uniref:SEC14-like protein 2 n=1 Tax=Araneus ventricosus TaxID=182803 RepID=A0A4Y2MKM3_ARAVE|nr:SEC14-like protein 2 [Araneus ventricosus]